MSKVKEIIAEILLIAGISVLAEMGRFGLEMWLDGGAIEGNARRIIMIVLVLSLRANLPIRIGWEGESK